MIGLDTNVLLRYIVQDDAAQAESAAKLIETRCTTEHPGYVDAIVLCEMVWVLDRGYGYVKEHILSVLWQLLSTAEIAIETPDVTWAAVQAYEKGSAGFADYLIGARNQAAGCQTTFTFDKKASGSAWHKAVKNDR